MRRLSKADYERRLPVLRDALLDAQMQLHQEKSAAVVVIVTGIPSAGRSEIVNQFLEWTNPKYVSVHALEKQRQVVRTRPSMWRFWNTLPARGEIAIYFLGWYEDYLLPALFTPKKARKHAARVVERIRQLETMLPQDRVRVLKLHLHVDKKTQRRRMTELQASKLTRWRVTDEDRWLAGRHDRVDKVADRCFRETSQKPAAWHVIDGTDPQHRSFEAGSLLLKELQAAVKKVRAAPVRSESVTAGRAQFPTRPEGESLDDEQYDLELEKLRGRFALIAREKAFAKRAAVFAFEGMDAAGKGGVIRRLTSALDARQYSVVSVSAPSPEELAHPYLWRFWRRIPERGELTVFDRSWYGRVLVERVRGLAAEADWQRAYDEIREFELQLAEHGIIVHKFWLAVSKQEQLKRLKARNEDRLKRFKVDAEDWANRRFYDAYQVAVKEMIERTDTAYAPWTVVEADDKKFARLKVLRTVCEAIERQLDCG